MTGGARMGLDWYISMKKEGQTALFTLTGFL
jgi:hypothetical protein